MIIEEDYIDRYKSPFRLSLDTKLKTLKLYKDNVRFTRFVGKYDKNNLEGLLGIDLDGGPMLNVKGVIHIKQYVVTILSFKEVEENYFIMNVNFYKK